MLLSLERDTVTRLQNLDEADCISDRANIIGKFMYSCLFLPAHCKNF